MGLIIDLDLMDLKINSFTVILLLKQEWEGKASVAGRKSGDLTFPLVYCPEFHYPEFNSAVADMKNSVAVSLYNRNNINDSFQT